MNLKKLFKPSEKLVSITFERSVFLDGIPYQPGDTVLVTAKQAAEAVAAGAARNPEAEAAAVIKSDDLQTLLPPPVEPEPIPNEWGALPKCFREWWILKESRRALLVRRDEIEKTLMGWYVGRSPNFSRGLTALPRQQSERLFETMKFEVNSELPQDLERLRFLKDAHHRAEQAIGDWNTSHLPSLIRFQLECSTHTQAKHGELCKAIRQLHATGYELFSLRIAALGLGEHKVAQLFQGSADCEKYQSIPAPSLQDLKLAWAEPGQDPVHYLAVTPSVMVSILAGYEATASQVETLAKQAERELAAARKVSSKAA